METKNKVALGVVGGMLVGAVVGLILAPKAGKETREALRERAEGLRERMKCHHDNGVDDPADHYAELLN